MTLKERLIVEYAPLFNGRLFFGTTPQGWLPADRVAPFCIVDSIAGEERRYVDNTLHDFENKVMQFFIWGERQTEVDAAAKALSQAVAASSTDTFTTVSVAAAVDDWNEQMGLRGSRQSFSFWYKEP